MDELDATAAEVLTASRALLGVVARSVAPVLEDVTLPQFRALVILSASPGPMRSGDLAVQLGIHQSTFTRTADRLVAADLIRRRENPDNRRETLIELAPGGARIVDLVTERRRAEIRAVLAGLSPGERDRILDAMTLFSRAAGEPRTHDLLPLGI